MAAKKNGLGKGLDSLIPNKVADIAVPSEGKNEKDESQIMMSIDKIEPNAQQPRKVFDEDALIELSESIKQHGVLSPLWVHEVKNGKEKYYEIIAGERRWRAAKKAGLKEVPVIIMDLTDQEIVEISLIENIQREDLNPIEEALAYKRLLEEFHLKQDEVAERVSKSRTAVTNSMRLLKLDERVQQMVIDEQISTGHARAILGITDKEKQYEFAQRVFDEKLSVRDVEKEVKRQQTQKDNNAAKPEINTIDPKLIAIYNDLQEQMKKIMGTKVSIIPKDNKKGKVEIEYYNQDELDRIVNLFQSIKNE
jgi:ParB family chromosome partitioning protein